jgi:hypothetical protein
MEIGMVQQADPKYGAQSGEVLAPPSIWSKQLSQTNKRADGIPPGGNNQSRILNIGLSSHEAEAIEEVTMNEKEEEIASIWEKIKTLLSNFFSSKSTSFSGAELSGFKLKEAIESIKSDPNFLKELTAALKRTDRFLEGEGKLDEERPDWAKEIIEELMRQGQISDDSSTLAPE